MGTVGQTNVSFSNLFFLHSCVDAGKAAKTHFIIFIILIIHYFKNILLLKLLLLLKLKQLLKKKNLIETAKFSNQCQDSFFFLVILF